MSKLLQALYERLSERFAALFGQLMATQVQTLHAEHEAECLNRLDELARRYEANGQPEIAARLRQRLRQAACDDPVVPGAHLLNQLGGATPPLALPPVEPLPPERPAPPVSSAPPTKTARRRMAMPQDATPTDEAEGRS
jgi:hypothetical protein